MDGRLNERARGTRRILPTTDDAMCHPASFVLTKDSVFWSLSTDSHTEIIAEYKLTEDGVRGVNVLKVEITPPNDDFAAPLEAWRYKIDQDLLPAWHDSDKDERRARKSLEEWSEARICRPGGVVVVKGVTAAFALPESTVTAYGSSTVRAYGSSTVRAYDSSTVTACENNATVRQYGPGDPPTPKGPFAVVIDCRGDEAIATVGA